MISNFNIEHQRGRIMFLSRKSRKFHTFFYLLCHLSFLIAGSVIYKNNFSVCRVNYFYIGMNNLI